ncbi:tyrosine-protein kinase STYK1b [Triplophysa rosa]|uniref:Tyrosine-protein kinase STYK1 n=1 Tax=Triplophysa rosa TaxID=992332 RepID=A0A9W7WR32_TRIRA|nr:tyrosine-protein kinase STYK1b [Triplophysa rosa]XP_057195689.1 tyrosine-protein kinase STYK1b [Triplophysa rosa]KAI7806748.1 putative tyrosine-protein kinase STYK1 [Triplophysa rosa]
MASTTSSANSECANGDTLCVIRVYEQEVIIVPVLFLMTFLVVLVFLLLLRYCPEKVDRLQPNSKRSTRNRRNLQGIDAPQGLNALEGERIALDTTSYMTFSTLSQIKENPSDHASTNVAFTDGRGSFGATGSAFTKPKELPRQRLPENFNGVSPLPASYSLKTDTSVSLYRARMENRNVVLRVLKDSASKQESQSFLGFASFLSQLGPNPFIPELLGVVSLRAPLITVMEEMENRDLLGFLWRSREDKVGPEGICEMTERKIFTMALHVSTALDYLHSKELLHCNVKARSVLVSRMFTAKLWSLGDLYARTSENAKLMEDPGRKKWQAPELLAKRPATPKSDVWSFGLLLFEMVTLGEVPFAEIPVTELLQYHQRGKTLKKPHNCSNSLYSIIKSCCQWKEHDRPSLADVRRKLQSGEKSANDSVVLRVPEPIYIERYLMEAGYGESNNYTIF